MNTVHSFQLFVGLGVLLIVTLAMNVSRLRIKLQIGNGDGNNPELRKAIRAHLNAVEHILPFSLLLLVLQLQQANMIFFTALAFSFLAVRVLHAYSLLGSQFRWRQIAAGLIYVLELIGCIAVIIHAI